MDWQERFTVEVADQIHAAWVAAIRRHWLQCIQMRGVPFTPLPYGCTLGCLVLTPQWWAVTGLGDWDLVRVGSDGVVELLGEEISFEPALETTASLCQDDAASAFAPRTRVELIDRAGAPFALLLSTDGVRKSCGATADYLTWCRDLVADLVLPGVGEGVPSLGERLDRLSRWGTGDDVSVAIAIHGDLALPRPIETEWSPQRLPRRQAACAGGSARGVRRSLVTGPWMLLWRRPALVLAMIVALALPSLGFVLMTLGGGCTTPWRSGPCGAFRH